MQSARFEELGVVEKDNSAIFLRIFFNDLRNISECMEHSLIFILLFFELFLFSLAELPSGFIENFIESLSFLFFC